MRVLLLLAILLSQLCFSQTAQKTIVVQGKAKMKVKPDVTFITFSIEKSDTSQSKAMAKANQLVDDLAKTLSQQGITKKQLKISDYRIQTDYESDKRRKTYNVSNTLIATILSNGNQINEILKNIEAQKMNGVDISFEYALSDSLERAVRVQLVQYAIADAKSNAENISQTLKIQLKTILKVSKEDREPVVFEKLESAKFTSPVIKRDTDLKFDSVFGNYDVEDKELTEEITIIYEINS